MKKFLLFILITTSFILKAQDKYKVDIHFRFHAKSNDRRQPICTSYSKIILNYDDGTSEEVFYTENKWYDQDFTFSKPKKIVSVRGIGFARRRRLVGGCKGDDEDFDRTISVMDCDTNQVSDEGDNHGTSLAYTLRAKLTPLHSLSSFTKINGVSTINTFLPSDDKITINDFSGFDSSSYNYQYSFDGATWINISPSLFKLDVLSISAKDLLGENYLNHLGQNIYIRGASCLENGIYSSVSDPIVLKVTESAPHISSSKVRPTHCFDTADGSVTLNFDRLLHTDETLSISLVNTDTGAAVINEDITNRLKTSTSYTLENLPPGSYKLDMLGTYKGNATYTDGAAHSLKFEVQKPSPVLFELTSQTNVYCFQGSDGRINLSASGGQNQYQYQVTKDGTPFLDWTDFTNGNKTLIQNLSAGVYKIKVRDSNFCLAKDPNNSSIEKEITVHITQPSQPIEFPQKDIEISQPTGYGLSNGYISIRVIGGTPKNDGSYNFEWRKDSPNGVLITSGITTDITNNPYTIKLDHIPAGKYYLTVKDKNYNDATSSLGNCGIISQEFIVSQPDPLIAKINVEKEISCNINNNYDFKIDLNNDGIADEAQDGSLKVTVTGGVGRYSYQWQKLNKGAFENIPGAIEPVLTNQSIGTYKILVHDVNNNKTDETHTFIYPPELKIVMSATNVSCYSDNTGMVSVNATGGTGNLSYQWNTMDTTPKVTGLSGGNYFVLVSDSKGCKVKGIAEITQPDPIVITDDSIQNPICFGSKNGEIKTSISGGKQPYSISWSNGVTTKDNIGISAGDYTLTVRDANGCSISKKYHLENPVALKVDLGEDITLCSGDTKTYDVTINDPKATYIWKNKDGKIIGKQPVITLSEAGLYSVIVTNSKGCIATDDVIIKNSSEVLNPEFLLSTHAYINENVILVNTSPTKPQKVEWIIPADNNIQVINKTEDYLELKFLATGNYEFGLKGIQGQCVKVFNKNVTVEENTSGINVNPTKESNITQFKILPNPNNGIFKILIKLAKENIINLRIIDMISHQVFPSITRPKSVNFEIPFSSVLPTGTYLVILETGDEAMVKRVIINN